MKRMISWIKEHSDVSCILVKEDGSPVSEFDNDLKPVSFNEYCEMYERRISENG